MTSRSRAPGDHLRELVFSSALKWYPGALEQEVIFSYLSTRFEAFFTTVGQDKNYLKSVRQVAKNDLPLESTGIPLERLVLPSGLPVLHENRTRRILRTLFCFVFQCFRCVFGQGKTTLESLDRWPGMTVLVFTLVESLGDTMQMYWETQ